MNLTERYINAVKRRLPKEKREEAEKDLRALIHEMTEKKGGYSEEIEKEVLNEIGNPNLFADKYLGRKRYLIGPELFYTYLTVVKILIIITVTLSAVGTVIKSATESQDILKSVANAINVMISTGLSTFGIVTLIFAMIEFNSKYEDLVKISKGWTVKNLREFKDVQKPFNRIGIAVSMLINIIWIYLVNKYYGVVGIYYTGADGLRFIPMLNPEVFSSYLPYINLVLVSQILFQFSKLIFRGWNLGLAGINMLINICSAAVFIIMVGDANLFHQNFVSEISRLSGQTKASLVNAFNVLRNVLYIIVIISTIADSVDGFWNAYRRIGEKY